jgi:hypothetical protein
MFICWFWRYYDVEADFTYEVNKRSCRWEIADAATVPVPDRLRKEESWLILSPEHMAAN